MIYFLEDDNNIRNFVIYALKNTGLDAEGFEIDAVDSCLTNV